MNGAHSHLIINHFPIIGLILGSLVLLIGILAKSSVTRRVGLFLFFVASVTALPTMGTGEDAEHVLLENLSENCCDGATCTPDVMAAHKKNLLHRIHEHEEKAESLMPFMWGILGLSLIALFLEWKNKSMALVASIVVLLIGILAAYFAKEVGTSGGEVSHPEIRMDAKS